MGMDVYGIDPKVNEIDDSKLSIYLKYKDMDFDDKWKELDKDEDLREQYWKQKHTFEDLNPGAYFRNNVWWWRPLWDYVCRQCEDILTEEDMDGCTNNSGYEINEDKALKIGIRLHTLVLDGKAKEWEDGYNKEIKELKEDDFRKNYPFSVDNVKEFARFCVESGGFKVC